MGTYHYQHTFAPAAISGGQVTANYNGGASGTSTINGDFSSAAPGDFVAAFTGLSGPQDPNFPAAPNVILGDQRDFERYNQRHYPSGRLAEFDPHRLRGECAIR